MYKFKDEFRTGIDFIDEQHEMLFDITNRTVDLLKNDYILDKYNKIIELIKELQQYAEFHFNEEEAYMESIGYKRMFTQKIEHQTFIKKLNDIDYHEIDAGQDQYIGEILKFLNDWLVEHIFEKDMLIGK